MRTMRPLAAVFLFSCTPRQRITSQCLNDSDNDDSRMMSALLAFLAVDRCSMLRPLPVTSWHLPIKQARKTVVVRFRTHHCHNVKRRLIERACEAMTMTMATVL